MDSRVSTGIAGLDQSLGGGIPRGSVVLISGGPGTGKSTFSLQFVISGALAKEKCIYVTTEQKEAELRRQTEAYGWKIDELIEGGFLKLVWIDILAENSILEVIRSAVSQFKPSRIVIDSISTFSEYAGVTDFAKDILLKRGGVPIRGIDQVVPARLSEKTMIKRIVASLMGELRGFNATVMLTSELSERSEHFSSDGVTEFLADGIIVLYYLGVGSSKFRSLQIKKMRYTSHDMEPLSYVLSKDGLALVKEKPFM